MKTEIADRLNVSNLFDEWKLVRRPVCPQHFHILPSLVRGGRAREVPAE
jgi:hypothetical protein